MAAVIKGNGTLAVYFPGQKEVPALEIYNLIVYDNCFSYVDKQGFLCVRMLDKLYGFDFKPATSQTEEQSK